MRVATVRLMCLKMHYLYAHPVELYSHTIGDTAAGIREFRDNTPNLIDVSTRALRPRQLYGGCIASSFFKTIVTLPGRGAGI